MLFLVFLRLFFYIVFLDAHPVSKSNSYVCEADEQLENVKVDTKRVINNVLNEGKNTYLASEVLQNPFDNKKAGLLDRKDVNFKRDLSSKEIDLIGSKKSESLCKTNKFHSLIKTYKCNDKSSIVKEKGFEKHYNMNQKTSSNPTTVSNIDDKPVLHNDLLMESTRSETELPATAEMEIILNEIKQREIQTMADHLPSFSNLIKNAVTEITFSTMPIVSESNVSPNLISFDDIGKNRFSSTLDGTQVHNSKLRNIFRRSIKEDTSTLANDVENYLQNKLKKAYKQIKNKFCKDLRNDMNKKTSTVKKQLDKKFSKKINMTQHTKNPKFNNSFATKSKIVKMHNNSTRSEVRKSRKTLFDQRNHQIESIDSTTHTIPSIGDDVSMLAVLENIIEKSQHDNEVILNTLSYGTEKHKQEKPKRDSPRGTLKRDIHQELNNKEDGLYTEYAHWESNKNNTRKLSEISKNDKRNNEISTEDTSYQGLSNKISYNDYVNGYKYYLNFQRDNDDQKYSSQIRYQAHKHHNVDDIGKFILDKIPHLPATRMRRYLVDYETMEDQDVSTKSEESWFKKHFFMFIDSNPPKKFHTSQIVPLKPSEVHNMRYDNAVLSTKQTFEKNESSLPIQQRKSKFVKRFDYNCLKGDCKQRKNIRKMFKRSNLVNHNKQKPGSSLNSDHRKNGFVDIDFINKPTAIIKLNNKNKKEHKLRNIFRKIRFGHGKIKKKEKRESQNMFKIFKGIKNIFKDTSKGSRLHKIFDYEILTTSKHMEQPYEVKKISEVLKTDELRLQIPNITESENFSNLSDLNSINSDRRQGNFLPQNKKPELSYETKDYLISYVNKKKTNDIAIEQIGTTTESLFHSREMNTISYTFSTAMTKNNIQNEVDEMALRLSKFSKNKEIQKTTGVGKELEKKKESFNYDDFQSKSLKDYQIERPLIHNILETDKYDEKLTSTNVYDLDKLGFSKINTKKGELFFFKTKYSPVILSTLSSLNYDNLVFGIQKTTKDLALKKISWKEILNDAPTMFTQDKGYSYLEEDKYFVPEKNSFTPTPIDFTAYEYDNSSYYQENKNYGKNKQYKLEPIPDDLITLAYDESITDLQENKHFVKKKNKYLKDLITLVYEKNDNNEVKNFVQTKNEYTVTPIDLPMLEYEKTFNIQEDKKNIQRKHKASPTPTDDIIFANDENSFFFKEIKNSGIKKKKVRTTFKDQATFEYDEGFNNLEKEKSSDQQPYTFRPTSDLSMSAYDKNFTTLEKNKNIEQKKYKSKQSHNDLPMFNGNGSKGSRVSQPVRHFNDNKDVNIKRPVTKVNTPPKQYYSTPIPMKNADFNKFLKNLDIDVESVTAPLSDPLPERIDAWDLFEQNVTGLINKQQKILKNYERFKSKHKNKKILDRPLVYGHIYPNSEKMNINNSKVKSSPPPLKSQKQLGEDKKSNKNSQKRLDRTKNEKNIMNDERLFKLKKTSMVFATSESLDLFQLNDPKKQPISSNKIGNFDVTLNNCRKSILGMHNSLLMKNLDDPNNLQLVTMKSKTSNKNDSNSRNMNNYRDRLPFTHMPAKNITTKAENNQLYKFINQKKKLSQTVPRRVQISGHSYKYDIIYQTPMNYWMQDLDTYDVYPTYNFNESTNTGRYKDYYPGMTSIKYENLNHLRFYRKDNFEQCINTTQMASKAEENYTPLEPLSTNYTLTPTGKVLKSNLSTATKKFKKYFYFALKEPKHIDDVVYFEPLLRRQINRKKEEKPTCKNKIQKRGIQSKNTFTAKGVAALEVVVDLVKSTETLNSKELRNASPDMEENKNVPYILTASKTDNHATNSIQVHIALPNNLNDRKRSLEPIKVRKVFSAVMSTPVDLEYQIRTFEDDNVTKMSQDVISPGLYLLVENTNITSPNLNFALKPIRNIGISNLLSFENNTCKNYIKTLSNGNVSKATINPDIITTVYSQLVKLDENIPVANETKSKRYIKDIDYNKIKRGISWDKMKRYFDHERVCNCRCKINTTMCKPCAASDAVISELTFEFDNLVNYVTDHCTEIQTFFWMNPTGGRKLKDSVHRLDTTLNNYYKRLHDKCRGRTCQMISTSIDKRECHEKYSKGKLLNHLKSLNVRLKNIVENDVFDENVFKRGKMCIASINKCINTGINKNINKRSFIASEEDINNKSFYTLNNVKVNLICNKDHTAHQNFDLSSNITNVMSFEDNVKTPLYFDVEEIKRDKKKGVKELLKKFSYKLNIGQNKRDRTLIKELKERNKRHSSIENRAKTPLMSPDIAIFWNKNFHTNVREIRRQRHLVKQSISTLSIVTVTEKSTTANTFILNNTIVKNSEANDKDELVALKTDTLNNNLNDLFKLLGGFKTVEMNKGDFELESTTKKQSTFASKKTVYNQTLTPLSNTKNIENTKKPYNSSTTNSSKLKSKTVQTNKQLCIINEERKTTRNISPKTLKPKTQHIATVLTPQTKVGFFNRLVGVSLKFLGKKENKEKPTSKSSYVEKRPVSKNLHKYKKKFVPNAEIKPSKDDDNISENNNVTASRNPTIIIIDDLDYTEKSTTTKKSNNNAMTRKLLLKTNKKTRLNLLEETKSADLSENKRNTTELVSTMMTLVQAENSNNNITQNNIKYLDYDIVTSITKGLRLTPTNLTTSRSGKYPLNNMFYKVSGKSTPSAKKSQVNEIDNNQQNVSMDDWATRTILTKSLNSGNNVKTTVPTIHDTESENVVTKMNVTKISPNKKRINTCNFESKSLKEADENGFGQICDISTTMAFVTKLQKSLINNNFENYVKNIPCQKYKRAPKYFTIRSCIRKPSKRLKKRLHQLKFLGNMRGNRFSKWDWIRDKRTVNDETRVEDDTEEGCKQKPLLLFSNYLSGTRKQKKNSDLNGNFIQLLDGENDYYENFIRGKDGIYGKSLKRRKRLDADMSELNEGLQNLPPLRPSIDEIYAMVADSITFDCNTSDSTKNRYSNYIWTTDRIGILDFKNVIVDGPKVYIKNVQTNNSGNYLCNTNNAIIRSIKLTVIELPTVDIVFTPLYEIESCSYDHLKNLQKLGKHMSLFTCKKECSARIDEPICLKDSMDGSILIRPIVVMSVKRQGNINCSAKCLRDLHCSKTLLLAKNAPALASVKVLIYDNDTKRILFPLREKRRSFVTHTLREKDANGHREYHSLAADMDPNSVNVVLLCSAGFYLVVGQKICAVCPPNTFSLEGENVCRNCPQGSSSEPGSRSCRLSLHSRKYRCPWKYECGAAVCMLSCVIACCYTVLRLLRQPVSAKEIKTNRKTRQGLSNINHEKKQKRRPLSPSRVILSRLLQGSFSSSRATDSQETRFELWKEKNTLPPLPPIDFEL